MILADTNKILLTATEQTEVSGLVVTGTKPREAGVIGKNATVKFNTGSLKISGLTATDTECYNLLEQTYSKDAYKISRVHLSSLKTGRGISHNVMNFYNLANGAEIVIENSEFTLNKSSNIVRLDNLTEASGVKILFKGCSWTYEGSGYSESDLQWMSPILLQPGSAAQQGKPTMGREFGWSVELQDCLYNGEPIVNPLPTVSGSTLESHVAIFSIYDPGVAEDFPYNDPEKIGFLPKLKVSYGILGGIEF